MLWREGFFQEIVGAVAHGLDRHRHIAMPGQKNDRQVRIIGLQALEQLQAAHARHAHVTDDNPWKMTGQLSQAVLGAGEQLHVETGQVQPLLDGAANTGFIFDNDH
ncbi:hypothetical protein D3C75_1184190 [compost metagenome]